MRNICFFCSLAAVILLAATASSQAALIPLSESLQETMIPAGFNLASSSSDRAPSYTTSGVVFDPSDNQDDGRNYLRTDDTDYDTVDFQAYVTVNAQIGTEWSNTANFFFGLGTGAIGQYGVPDRDEPNDTITFQINFQDDGNMRNWGIEMNSDSGFGDGVDEGAYPASVSTETHRLMMDYDATAGSITFGIDYDYTGGPFTADLTTAPVDVSGLWQTGDAASVYFGGDGEATAWDLLIVPEPATLGLMMLGGLGAVIRRRDPPPTVTSRPVRANRAGLFHGAPGFSGRKSRNTTAAASMARQGGKAMTPKAAIGGPRR
ncbi:MAG: PEP-CTERM sorting domain-containing protein [Phycisphaerae bacterium]